MKTDIFNKVIEEQLLTCKNILCQKGLEYTPNAIAETSADVAWYVIKAPCIYFRYVR